MTNLLLSILLFLSPVAAPAPDYEVEAGTSGFSGYSLEAPVAAAPLSPAPVSPVEATEELIEVRAQEPSATRSGERTAPPTATGGVLSAAASYVGYPYVLYGTPPAAFDCSSFTWYVFQQAGVTIPQGVAAQSAAVTPVSDPQPGDLIFYNDWHHVGIYAGNGMTYEALNPETGVRFGPILSDNVWFGRP